MSNPPPYDHQQSLPHWIPSRDYDLAPASHSFVLDWAVREGLEVDVDLQCVLVNFQGSICDAAYYNNLKAAGRGVTHTGDEQHGAPDAPKSEEKVTLHFSKLQRSDIKLVVVVVAAFAGGSLADVERASVRLLNEDTDQAVSSYDLKANLRGGHNNNSLLHCVVHRDSPNSGAWKCRLISEFASGRHFMDVLPELARAIRTVMPSAPAVQRCNFQMSKGNVVEFGHEMRHVTAGLGWDTSMGQIDLDVSAVLFDAQGKNLEAVFFGNLKSTGPHSAVGAVRHSGDNLTGEGEGDDEQIVFDLDKIGPQVQQVFICINIYTRGRSFAQVANPYCRVVDDHGHELCAYRLAEAGDCTALVIARIARDPRSQRWGFHALGLPSGGTMWRDCLPAMQQLFFQKTGQLLRTQTTAMALGEVAPPPMPYGQQGPTQVILNIADPPHLHAHPHPPPPCNHPAHHDHSHDKCCVIM